jgi:hypothetical protein
MAEKNIPVKNIVALYDQQLVWRLGCKPAAMARNCEYLSPNLQLNFNLKQQK